MKIYPKVPILYEDKFPKDFRNDVNGWNFTKEELQKNLGQSIYLSFDFIRQYKSWDSVKVTYEDKTKKIYKWKFDDLSYKMGAKRPVGKIQPEKSKERSEYNFTIDIKGDYYDTNIETMGKDYIKISTGEGDQVAYSYYEVHTGLYDYLVNDLFKLNKQQIKKGVILK